MNKKSYYIGDLCYIVKADEWSKIIDRWEADKEAWAAHKYKEADFALCGTSVGDGCFEGLLLVPTHGVGSKYFKFGVNSGTLGIIAKDSPLVDAELVALSLATSSILEIELVEGELGAEFEESDGDGFVYIYANNFAVVRIQTIENEAYDEDDDEDEEESDFLGENVEDDLTDRE